MTENELRLRYESDANADPDKAGLKAEEVTTLLKDWFYTGSAFDSSLANPRTARYCRAVAAGFRQRMVRASDPNKYMSQSATTEITATLFNNFATLERRWLADAERYDEETRTAESGGRSAAPTTTYRAVPSW